MDWGAGFVMECKIGGCSNPVQDELRDHTLCLEHFLSDVHERIVSFARQLEERGPQDSLRKGATRFIVLTAAKIATIGTQHPPGGQLVRGQLLNAMLMLVDLRERFDKATGRNSSS